MKVKMTRTERALRKAQKAAKVAYKASKAPAITEFFWDEKDYMSPEELFWVDLDAACAAAQAPWDVKEQIAEYAKGLVHLKDNTVGQVIDGWLMQSYAPSWALTLDLYVGTYLPLVSYTIDIMTTYGTEIGNLESKAHDEKWCYDHDEYLKKARAVRGPVDEPCDPYEWDDEDIDF